MGQYITLLNQLKEKDNLSILEQFIIDLDLIAKASNEKTLFVDSDSDFCFIRLIENPESITFSKKTHDFSLARGKLSIKLGLNHLYFILVDIVESFGFLVSVNHNFETYLPIISIIDKFNSSEGIIFSKFDFELEQEEHIAVILAGAFSGHLRGLVE